MLISEAVSLEELVILQRLNQSSDRDPVKSLLKCLLPSNCDKNMIDESLQDALL